jgi:hypothetical protein
VKIKEGFNSKPLMIRISTSDGGERVAGVWIEQIGLKDEREPQRYETLAYATLDELLDLQKELKEAIQELIL